MKTTCHILAAAVIASLTAPALARPAREQQTINARIYDRLAVDAAEVRDGAELLADMTGMRGYHPQKLGDGYPTVAQAQAAGVPFLSPFIQGRRSRSSSASSHTLPMTPNGTDSPAPMSPTSLPRRKTAAICPSTRAPAPSQESNDAASTGHRQAV